MDVVAKARQRVTQLEAELLELKEFLGAADRIDQRLTQPSAQKSKKPLGHAAKLEGNGARPPQIVVPQVRSSAANRTADMAEEVLRVRGDLHVNGILDRLYELGWKSSGDRKKDYKSLHIALASKPQRFRAVGKGIFAIATIARTQ